MRGFTCGLDDLCLTKKQDKWQASKMKEMFQNGVEAFEKHTNQSIGESTYNIDFFNRPKFMKK